MKLVNMLALIALSVGYCSSALADETNNQQTTAQKAADKTDQYIRSIASAPPRNTGETTAQYYYRIVAMSKAQKH
jgi:hypothetical protein